MNAVTFSQRLLAVSLLALCSTSAWAQNSYVPPKAYGSAVPESASGDARRQPTQVNSVGVPAGRPAPSAPMPSPLPPGIDKVQTAIDQAVPMTANELRQLMKELFERQSVTQENVTSHPPAKPTTSVEMLDLSPGSTPPVVRVAFGQGAVISFSDSAGRPWTILDNLNANSRAFEGRLIGPHLYSVTLKTREAANLTIVLKDLPRPIVLTLLPATTESDYLKEYTVPRFIDGAPPATVAASSREGALSFNSPELISYLYRTPPKGAKALTVAGLPGVLAWQSGPNKMVVRTAGQVVIPAFSRRHAASDGVAVFELPLSPVISITEGGALHRVSIGDYQVEAGAISAAKK